MRHQRREKDQEQQKKQELSGMGDLEPLPDLSVPPGTVSEQAGRLAHLQKH